jgi:hypothetical protein
MPAEIQAPRNLKRESRVHAVMKGLVAWALVVVALLLGVTVGYLGSAGRTTTMTVTTTYRETIPGVSGDLKCVLSHYSVWYYGRLQNSTTSFGFTTVTADLQTYTSTTSVIQSIGYTTVTSTEFTGTLTGAVAAGNYTTCVYT